MSSMASFGDTEVVLAPHHPDWALVFSSVGERLRSALGEVAIRIDHVGSTAIEGMPAKPAIDVQVSVTDLEPLESYKDPLEQLGYGLKWPDPILTRRFFREPEGQPRTHLHVRTAGSFGEQSVLLFRDFLREHSDWAAQYASVKRELADKYPQDRRMYTAGKHPMVWQIMAEASEWSNRTGWSPPPSDA